MGYQDQFPSHLADVITQRGQQHIAALLKTRDGVLSNPKSFGHVLLRQSMGLPQIAQRPFLSQQLRCTRFHPLTTLGAKLGHQLFVSLTHLTS